MIPSAAGGKLSKNKENQAAYKARRRADGLARVEFWVRRDQKAKARAIINALLAALDSAAPGAPTTGGHHVRDN
jgi:hypothetical protein